LRAQLNRGIKGRRQKSGWASKPYDAEEVRKETARFGGSFFISGHR
jgi:hypothetical protein